jgi:hypothetical protein
LPYAVTTRAGWELKPTTTSNQRLGPSSRRQKRSPGWPWIWPAMLGLSHCCEHGIAVSGHLRVVVEDMVPTAVVQHDPPAVRIDEVRNDGHGA